MKLKVVVRRLSTNTKKYFTETGLHGFRYIADPKSSRFKSYFWTLVCTISTCLCVLLIRSQFRYFYSNRITTTILTTAFPIWEVPFPAVTVCNLNLVYKEHTNDLRKLLEKYATGDEVDDFFTNLSSLVLTAKVEKEKKWDEHRRVSNILEWEGYNSEHLMSILAHPCTNMVTDCYWNGKQTNCSEIFHLVKTNAGYCCSFNYRAVKRPDDEYYVTGVGPSYGLYAHLNIEEEQYVSPIKHGVGIDVSVHENVQYPDMSISSTTVRPGSDVSLSVKPELTESEESVRGVDISSRGCTFADEAKMTWSEVYSYSTCMNECRAKAIKNLCGCVPFYYSAVKGTTRFCALPDLTCIKRNDARLKNSRVGRNDLKCKCYPPCNEITYSYQQDLQPLKIPEGESRTNESILRVYFSHVSCMKLLRSVFITWELILASVGGLIGLCLGGSILSIIELVYHIVETLCTRYGPRRAEPKLYLSDFGTAHKVTEGGVKNSKVN